MTMSKRVLSGILMAIFLLGAIGIVPVASGKDPIKVGVPLPMTGPYASDGVGYYRGIKFAVDEINEAGGLLSRSLEIIRFDTLQGIFNPLGKEKGTVIENGT